MVMNELNMDVSSEGKRKPNSLRSQSSAIGAPVVVATLDIQSDEVEEEHTTTFSDFSGKTEPMSREQEFELLARVKRGDEAARNEICERSKRLVVKMARNYIGRGLDFDDLVQEGLIGVLKAIDKYEPSHESGSRFSTYASYWIKREMCDSINQYSRSIKIPAHIINTHSKIGKAMKKLSQELNREPSLDEISEYLELPITKIEEVMNHLIPVESIDSPSPLVEDQTLGDIIQSGDDITEELGVKSVMLRQMEDHLRRILFDEREFYIIVHHKGLFGNKEQSFQEIGDHLGITRERVRQIEAQAESRMREDPKFKEFGRDF